MRNKRRLIASLFLVVSLVAIVASTSRIRDVDMAKEMMQAESRIRDVDMAKEMTQSRIRDVDMAKETIVLAAGMLAQANQAPQTVLQLLG